MHDPLAQFLVFPWFHLHVWGYDLSFTNSSFFLTLSVFLPLLFFFCATYHQRMIPGPIQSMAEMAYVFISRMVDETSGDRGKPYFPFLFSVFLFVAVGNFLGLVPFSFTVTSQLIVTSCLAVTVFCVVTLIGLIKHRGKFFSLFFPAGAPVILAPVLIPIELLSYLSRPVSLSVRLFANMVAGHTMLKVFAGFTASLGIFGVFPVLLNVVLTAFEVLVAVLQAYVFTVLSCLYLHDALYLHHKG